MAPVTDLGVCNFYRIKKYKDNLFQKWIRCPKELITAAKRSLEQGNIFTGVFLSTRGWLASMHHRSRDQGGLHPGGGSASGGGLHPGGSWANPTPPPTPRYMGYNGIQSTSGGYASYWHAFLFVLALKIPDLTP